MSFVTDCDYCGQISLCENHAGGTGCTSCIKKMEEEEEAIRERRDFDTIEEAWDAIRVMTDDDPFCDNSRFAYTDDAEGMEKYEKQAEEGCCGFVDILVTIGGAWAMIGLNYGH